MNIAILVNESESYLQIVDDILLVNIGKDSILPDNTPNDFLNSYAMTAIKELSRSLNTTDKEAKEFIDTSTFDAILKCLKKGQSYLGNLHPGLLAQIFCHISDGTVG